MLDKYGKEMKTGDIVRVSGAYFKNDNGLFFVQHSPGDVGWSGEYCSLKKVSQKGKVSTAKYNLSSWPLSSYVSNREKRIEARAWNQEHAEIEIVDNVDVSGVAEEFKKEIEECSESIWYSERLFGEDSEITKITIARKVFLESVYNSLIY